MFSSVAVKLRSIDAGNRAISFKYKLDQFQFIDLAVRAVSMDAGLGVTVVPRN